MRNKSARAQFYDRQFSRVSIKEFSEKITSRNLLYFGGSCFAENLYTYWQNHFLSSVLSPFGSTYNPLSLKESLLYLCEKREIKGNELFRHRGLWNHSLFNSTVSRIDKNELLTVINREITRHSDLLGESDFLILTLGTAFVYEEILSGSIVNNCHKRPASDFRRRVLSPEEVSKTLMETRDAVRLLNPSVKIILSLSPVRHLRDDAGENSLSKAVLRCGINDYLKNCSNNSPDSFYFPSYEIMLDELRDYRWYSDDLSHPSQAAISYIMERFCETAAHPSLLNYLKEAESIINLFHHRILNPHSPEALDFINNKEQKLKDFQRKYPMALLPLSEAQSD